MRSVRSGTSDDEGRGQVFTEVGVYKGTVVAIRRSERPAIKLTRQDLVELKEASHHISPFTFCIQIDLFHTASCKYYGFYSLVPRELPSPDPDQTRLI